MSNKYIHLGNHKVRVLLSESNHRMVFQRDVKSLLQLHENNGMDNYYIDAGMVTDRLFHLIYVEKTSTKEQKIIFNALCIVGIYSLIDEVCDRNLRNVSYVNEFNKYIRTYQKKNMELYTAMEFIVRG